MLEIAKKAKAASLQLQKLTLDERNRILEALKNSLAVKREEILKANEKDLEAAKELVDHGKLSSSLFGRLGMADSKFTSLVDGLNDLIKLPDPLGVTSLKRKLDDDLLLERVSCPVGVLLVIFEARPEVLIQISSLAIKSGNAVILKGGREASATLAALLNCFTHCLSEAMPELSKHVIQLVFSRDEVGELLHMEKYIDLVIPRGSNQLVRSIQEKSRIPVLGHADGLCSIYVDEDADIDKSLPLIVDAKTDYPAACNSVETVLIHTKSAKKLLTRLIDVLSEKKVELRLCESSFKILQGFNYDVSAKKVVKATNKDFDTEFVDLILAAKIVNSLDEAIEHINEHGSKHTDCILTTSKDNADRFMREVDSAGVYWNASTRFADGYRYGFGAEVGVSTNKTHARGPVGLEGLLIYKYRLQGDGNCASWYSSNKRSFKHETL